MENQKEKHTIHTQRTKTKTYKENIQKHTIKTHIHNSYTTQTHKHTHTYT